MTERKTTALFVLLIGASLPGSARDDAAAALRDVPVVARNDAIEPAAGPAVERFASGELGFSTAEVTVRIEDGSAVFDSACGRLRFSTSTSSAEAVGGGVRSTARGAILEEWFLPTARGVEHLFVVEADVSGRTLVAIDVDGFQPQLESEARIAFVDGERRTQFFYEGLHVWDAFHRSQTAYFDLTKSGFSIVVETDDTTVGPLTIDPLFGVPQTIAGVTAGENFGQGIGVGDFNNDGIDDLAVGATDAGGVNRGVIRVYKGVLSSGLAATPTFNINLTAATIGSDCGDAVEIGDVNGDTFGDIVYSCRNLGDGTVMVHLGPNPSTTTANFTLSDPNCIGTASRGGLVLANVVGADAKDVVSTCGFGRLVVWDVQANSQGPAVASFDQLDPSPPLGSMITAMRLSPNDAFHSIALVGSGTTARIYVGGQGTTGLSTAATVSVTIPTSDTQTHALAAGDFDFDGDDDLIIGDEIASSGAGRAYTFVNNFNTSSTFTQNTNRTFTGSAGQRRGMSIGLADLNKDNYADATVCRPGSGIAPADPGSCETFRGGPGGLENASFFTITGTINLGDTPEISAGDFRGDGGRDLVIPEKRANSEKGAVLIRNFTPATVKSTNEILPESNVPSGFGGAVAMGDLNNDGFDDLAVGGSGALAGRGAVFVYFGGPSSDNTVDWCTKGSLDGDRFGAALAIARVRNTSVPSLIVGAPAFDNDRGRIDVFHAPLSGGCILGNTPFTPNQSIGGLVDFGRYGSALANAGTALQVPGFARALP
jgi:hypothetical protein